MSDILIGPLGRHPQTPEEVEREREGGREGGREGEMKREICKMS